jgi:hypothetical protein
LEDAVVVDAEEVGEEEVDEEEAVAIRVVAVATMKVKKVPTTTRIEIIQKMANQEDVAIEIVVVITKKIISLLHHSCRKRKRKGLKKSEGKLKRPRQNANV